jgi:hypothetical protein
MVNLAVAIIRLAIDTTDSRTRHLSDHIYHLVTFAAVTLCRILNLYEPQVAAGHDVSELDALILGLVSWLHSIGLSSHIGYTMGSLVSTLHRRLRPDAIVPSPALDHATPMSMSDFWQVYPALLSTDAADGNDWSFVPDWEPFFQGPLT